MCFFWGVSGNGVSGYLPQPFLPPSSPIRCPSGAPPVPAEGSLIAVSVKFHEFANTHLGVQQVRCELEHHHWPTGFHVRVAAISRFANWKITIVYRYPLVI